MGNGNKTNNRVMGADEFDSDNDLPLATWPERNQQDNAFVQADYDFNKYVHFDDRKAAIAVSV